MYIKHLSEYQKNAIRKINTIVLDLIGTNKIFAIYEITICQKNGVIKSDSFDYIGYSTLLWYLPRCYLIVTDDC